MFSLSEQLSAACRPQRADRPARSELQTAHVMQLHDKQRNNAILKYREALRGKGWMSTAQVEWALGYNSTVANAFLRKLHKEGFIAHRPRYGAERYNKRQGWEFQWIKD